MEVSRKSVLLTGAGSGIGRATAIEFARKGARLTLVGRRQEPLEETARLVSEAGGEAQVISGDVTAPEVRQRAIQAAVERFGGLDVLINNAGAVRAGRLENIDTAEIQAQIEANLTAPILLIRAALPALRDSGDAAIVNVSSRFGLVGMPFYSAYAATKAGIAHFGEALRRELYGEGVHVMTVYPGATDTAMMESNEAGPDLGFEYESPKDVAAAIVAGVEAGDLEIVRGAKNRSEITQMSRERPRELDEQVAQMKDALESAVADHRSL
ncbi:MAG: SDR family NAD(P)-dependent oxidoreductase [Actinobacteria bacterium]|nr:SDR family NAD(P)-dependent oxidoreductase [Actinomycetota bacterium]